MATVHIIGAGISGLAAATKLAEAHVPVRVYEASAHAGGRCRASRAAGAGMRDHGLHLTATSDREWRRYLARIGAADGLQKVMAPRLPTAPLIDYLPLLSWVFRPRGQAEHAIAADSQLRDAWFAPVARLFFASPPAQLPARAIRRQWKRLASRRLWQARDSLQENIIQPALDYLEERGASLYFSHKLTRLERQDGQPAALVFGRKKLALAPGDIIIFATAQRAAAGLLGLPEAAQHSAITLHFAVAHDEAAERIIYPIDAPMDVVRFREGVISASLRIADYAWAGDEAMLAARIWKAIGTRVPALRDIPLPDYTSHREKQAGHALRDEAPLAAEYQGLILAGDWLDPLTPPTLEAAAASGHRAAALAQARLPKKLKREQAHPFKPVAKPMRIKKRR